MSDHTPPPPPDGPGQGSPPAEPSPPRPWAEPTPPQAPPSSQQPQASWPPPAGWYAGPFPLPGMVAKESFWGALGRTAAKSVVAVGVAGAGIFCVVVLLAGVLAALNPPRDPDSLATDYVAGARGNGNHLLAVPVRGLILGEEQERGLFAPTDVTYGYEVQRELELAAEDNSVKGVILELDTPGGTIYGSRAIADAVATYRERTGRPVLAWVSGLAASGGMYAMSGASTILADHGTLVGSIGVIFGPITHYDQVVATDGGILGGGVETRNGITEEYITAGRGKDLGNPYRPMTEEERATLQQGVDRSYGDFVATVAEGRDLDRSAIVEQIGALVYDEATAVDLGLVDEVANRRTTYDRAAELAGLRPGNWQVKRVDRDSGSLLDALGARFGLEATPASPCVQGPQLLAVHGTPPRACGQ
ncbi:MAG: S49 family peptidase [Acidimicrobiia bacterium]|nr:S49 family peptidase [Acidimicrobiia bacterium]